MSDHLAKPVFAEREPTRDNPLRQMATKTCRVCGGPIERARRGVAPGAWRHSGRDETPGR